MPNPKYPRRIRRKNRPRRELDALDYMTGPTGPRLAAGLRTAEDEGTGRARRKRWRTDDL